MFTLMTSQEEVLCDLECGESTSYEVRNNFVPVSKKGDMAFIKGCRGTLNCNGSISDSNHINGIGVAMNVTGKTRALPFEQSSRCKDSKDLMVGFDKKNPSDQSKNLSLKKASKPPRHPKGPSLTASDIKFVKWLTELAARKRARIQRMKAARKIKKAKPTSFSTNLTALIIGLLLFVIIIFQAGRHIIPHKMDLADN